MGQTWHSLYLPTSDAESALDALRALLSAAGYTPYDPFPGGTGTPPGLHALVRLFAAPPQDGWLRILGEPVEALLPDLSAALEMPVLYGWLGEAGGGFALFSGGERHTDPAAFEPYLSVGRSLDELRSAFAGTLPVDVVDDARPGADSLSPELRRFAREQGVDPRKASQMAERLSDSVFGRLSRDDDDAEQDQARAIVMGGGRDVWNSLAGQRVRAIAGVLRLPANWRLPTWETVRDAYHVHRLRQRHPRMALLASDRQAMAALPNALDYVPVFMGQL